MAQAYVCMKISEYPPWDVNNNDADQPPHPHSLLCTFVIHSLESRIDRGPYMGAHVLLNFKELGKSDKMRGMPSEHFITFSQLV